ncbi:ATP-binding cassette long-chain fatty acid transporter pxa1 [Pestalotiopsis sp. IQ-011]
MPTPVYGPGPPRSVVIHGSRHSSIQHLPVIEERDEDKPKGPFVSAAFWFPHSPPQAYHFGAEPDSSGVEDNVDNVVWVPPTYGVRNNRKRRSRGRRRSVRWWYYSRRPAWLAGRGGWRRLALFATFVLVCVVGLVLGLVLGLRRNDPDSYLSSDAGDAAAGQLFPAGSYAFQTALASTSTACTTNADTFRCFPYTTSNASAPGAEATFYWIISQSSSSYSSPQPEYVVSAAPNPFAARFVNVSAAVLDRGTASERLAFRLPLDLGVAAGALDPGDDSAATCWFNGTGVTLGATVWTRRRAADFSSSSSSSSDDTVASSSSASSNFAPWPFAVQVERLAVAAPEVPTCVTAEGRTLGQFGVAAGGGSCGCVYNNFGTTSS